MTKTFVKKTSRYPCCGGNVDLGDPRGAMDTTRKCPNCKTKYVLTPRRNDVRSDWLGADVFEWAWEADQ